VKDVVFLDSEIGSFFKRRGYDGTLTLMGTTIANLTGEFSGLRLNARQSRINQLLLRQGSSIGPLVLDHSSIPSMTFWNNLNLSDSTLSFSELQLNVQRESGQARHVIYLTGSSVSDSTLAFRLTPGSMSSHSLSFTGSRLRNASVIASSARRPWSDVAFDNGYIQNSELRVSGVAGVVSLDQADIKRTHVELTRVRDVNFSEAAVLRGSYVRIAISQDGKSHRLDLFGARVQQSTINVGDQFIGSTVRQSISPSA